jgi:LmbE family N-acetylglucosaminyl deacetylase
MGLAGVPPGRLIGIGLPDQEAALNLAALARDLVPRLAGCALVLTHAYEGGHPDHDATAFAVHAAAALTTRPPALVEMPLYRAGPAGRVVQAFAPAPGVDEVTVELSAAERRLKEKMFAAHASQRDVLAWFTTERERFRLAPAYDFRLLPNGGALLYESFEWGLSGGRWLRLAQAALEELGLPSAPRAAG